MVWSREQANEYAARYREKHRKELVEKQRLYVESHKEEVAKFQKEYHEKNKDTVNAKLREKRAATPEKRKEETQKYKETYKRYRDAHKSEYLQWGKKYNNTPKGKVNSQRKNCTRRSKGKDVENTLTLEQWQKILSQQNNKCTICGKFFSDTNLPSRDHIIPLNPNEPNIKPHGLTFENTQAVCRSCNSSKGNRVDYSKIITWVAIEKVSG